MTFETNTWRNSTRAAFLFVITDGSQMSPTSHRSGGTVTLLIQGIQLILLVSECISYKCRLNANVWLNAWLYEEMSWRKAA